MLHQFLKEATKPNHDELEQLMFVNEIMNGTLSFHQYQQILTANYIVHKNFEDHLFDNLSPELAQQLDIAHRRKLPALIADMDELKMDTSKFDLQQNINFDTTDASILGALYVMEGATLGGSVIVKRLQTNPQLNHPGLNFNYYRVYGDNLIPYWKTFCALLDQQPENTYNDALEAAQTMFNCIAQVQQQNNKLLV